MNAATRAAFAVMGAGCFVALAAQELFYASGIGINLGIVNLLILTVIAGLMRFKVLQLKKLTCLLAVPSLVSSAGLILRDSRGLDALNILVLAFTYGFAAVLETTEELPKLSQTTFLSPLYSFGFGFIGLIVPFEADWKSLRKSEGTKSKIAPGLWLGGLLAVPVLLIFGSILANADPMFARLFQIQFDWDVTTVFTRTFIFVLTFFLVIGMLCLMQPEMRTKLNVIMGFANPVTPPPAIAPEAGEAQVEKENQGIYIFSMFFGLIALMFLLFIGVQFRYLFGGNEFVLKSAGLTYAQYARNGFFQIATVTALTIPLLLAGQSSLKDLEPGQTKLFGVIAGALATMLLLLLASAFYRMNLYVDAYGLSSLRLYVTAGMVWMAAIIGLYFALGLRWQLPKYGLASVGAACLIALGMNMMQPDAVIARVNLSRSEKSVDKDLLSNLGADAYPIIEASNDPDLITKWWQNFQGSRKDWKGGSVSELRVKSNEVARAKRTNSEDRNFYKPPQASSEYAMD